VSLLMASLNKRVTNSSIFVNASLLVAFLMVDRQ
jgi:hypothetical protein